MQCMKQTQTETARIKVKGGINLLDHSVHLAAMAGMFPIAHIRVFFQLNYKSPR